MTPHYGNSVLSKEDTTPQQDGNIAMQRAATDLWNINNNDLNSGSQTLTENQNAQDLVLCI